MKSDDMLDPPSNELMPSTMLQESKIRRQTIMVAPKRGFPTHQDSKIRVLLMHGISTATCQRHQRFLLDTKIFNSTEILHENKVHKTIHNPCYVEVFKGELRKREEATRTSEKSQLMALP